MNNQEQRITPFSNGTEAMMWHGRNCDQCAKQWDPNNPNIDGCEIEAAISGGSIPIEMWKRAGEGKTQCTELVARPEPTNDYSIGTPVRYVAKYAEIDGRKRLVF